MRRFAPLLLALFLTACGTPATPTDTLAPTTAPPTAATTVAPEPVTTTASPDTDGIYKFGDGVVWDDGLSVNVSAPKEIAAADEYHANVVVEVSIVNGTAGPVNYNPLAFSAQDSAGYEHQGGDFGIIVDNDLNSGTLLPGRSVKGMIGCRLANGMSIVAVTMNDNTRIAVWQ